MLVFSGAGVSIAVFYRLLNPYYIHSYRGSAVRGNNANHEARQGIEQANPSSVAPSLSWSCQTLNSDP